MSLVDIRKLLMGQIELLNFTVAFENKAFNGADADEYIELSYMPNPPVGVTLGDDGEDEVDGYLQITIHTPLGKGAGRAAEIAETIRSHFYIGRSFVTGGTSVTIMKNGPKPGFKGEKTWATPFILAFYSRVPRRTT
jgi:hypothetical protein